MRNAPQHEVNSRTVEWLQRLLAGLPDDPALLAAHRRQVMDQVAAFDPARDPLAASLQRCVTTLRQRFEATRRAVEHAPPGAEPAPAMSFHAQATVAVPEKPPAAEAPRPLPTREMLRWNPAERLLYEDVVRLFDLGDQAGAMISLERLVMLSPDAEELAVFLDKNGELLARLYRDALGSLDRVMVPVKDRAPVRIPARDPAMLMDVLRMVDGQRSLRDLVKKVDWPELRTLIVVSHLARSGFLELA
jgi:hypothetical protein